MTYQAIARRCRPQRFEDVVGQTHITQTIQNAIRLGRIHHAFLFCGTRGVGKTTAARILAKALNCEHGPAENPCNECENCREITRGGHPDVTEIDGASNNRVDDIRELIDTVRYLPSKSRSRIYIIDEVHMVTQQAFNALLKTLEEPPEHVVFIFATTEPQKIPETVLSRCQRFDFKMLPQRTIYGRLKQICEQEGLDIPESVLMPIAREAAGSMRDGQSLLDQVLSFADGPIDERQATEILGLVDRKLLHQLLQAVAHGETDVVLSTYVEIIRFGVDPRSLANEVLALLRHAAVAALTEDTSRLIDLPGEEIAALGELGQEVGIEAVQRRFDILSRATDELARSDTPDLVLEMALIRMSRVRPYVPVDALVDRLLDLERRVLKAGAASLADGAPARPLGPLRPTRPAPLARAPEARPAAPAPRPDTPPPRPATRPAPVDEPPPIEEAPPPADTPPALADDPPPIGAAPAPPAEKPAAPPVDSPAQAVEPPRPVVEPPAPAPGPETEPVAEPETEPTPPALPPTPKADLDREGWLAFLASISGSTSAILAEGRFRSVEGDALRLGFSKPSTMAMADKRLATARGQKALAAFFGRPVKILCEPIDAGDDGPLSPAEQARADAAKRKEEREERARSHPAVARVESTFPGAEITRIRHLVD